MSLLAWFEIRLLELSVYQGLAIEAIFIVPN